MDILILIIFISLIICAAIIMADIRIENTMKMSDNDKLKMHI